MKNGDILLLKDDSIRGMIWRVKEYGPASALLVNKPVSIGVVSEFNGELVVIEFGSKVQLHRIDKIVKRIVKVVRNRKYITQYSSIDLTDRAMAVYASEESIGTIKALSNRNFPATCLYILTSSEIVYPASFANFDFKLSDVTAKVFGYREVEYGD